MKLLALLVLLALASGALAEVSFVENGYWRLELREGEPVGLWADPAGASEWKTNLLYEGASEEARKSVLLGFEGLPTGGLGAPLISPSRIEWPEANALSTITAVDTFREYAESLPVPVPAEGALTQTFLLGEAARITCQGRFPTWGEPDCGITLKLRQGGPEGPVISQLVVAHFADNDWIGLDSEGFLPPGVYALEASAPRGTVGWWASATDNYADGQPLRDGQPAGEVGDFTFRLIVTRKAPAHFSIGLDGPRLTLEASWQAESQPRLRLLMPWQQEGYEARDARVCPFHHFYTESDLWVPIEQFKRRPFGTINTGAWCRAVMNDGYDLLFGDGPGTAFLFHPDWVEVQMGCGKLSIEALPAGPVAPPHFPRFTGSDGRAADLATQFLYSHGLNFGAGTPGDWKHWQSLILDWQDNFHSRWQRKQLEEEYHPGHIMAPDGYVKCWGNIAGWPFPYKDEDKNGENDYDTRHFATNPSFILGAWRLYCFNQESDLLAKMMPNLRLAMRFMLEDCKGETGLMLANGDLHTGKPGGIGSNYWDILPFGWKDAFSDSLFVASLAAMAQLEEAYGKGDGYSPEALRALAEEGKRLFDETFWLPEVGRWAGCVDVDGKAWDYGFTFINTQALALGLGDGEKARQVYEWMEHGLSSEGKADIYSKWIFAPRATTLDNPPVKGPQEPLPSWWAMNWPGTEFNDQCQDGGAILYTSFDDLMARARWLGAESAWQRFGEILDRYALPDRLAGGSPLSRGEKTQGGPGGSAGSVGVEGEFPESGMVPCYWLYGLVGAQPDIRGLLVQPRLPEALEWAGVEGLIYAGGRMTLTARPSEVSYTWEKGDRKVEEAVALPKGKALLIKADGSNEVVEGFLPTAGAL